MKSLFVAAVAGLCAAAASPAAALPLAQDMTSVDIVSKAQAQRRPVCRTGYVRRWVRGRWRVTPHRRCL